MKKFTLFFVCLFSFLISNAQFLQPVAINQLPDNYGSFSISVVDDNTVWSACGNQNSTSPVSISDTIIIIKTTDGGITWQQKKISNFPGYFPMDIFALNKDTAFVALNSFGNGFVNVRTYDGGNTWTWASYVGGSGVWIRFFNDLDGVIINTGTVATTNNGGQAWQTIPSSNIPPFMPNELTIIPSGNNSCVTYNNSIWFATNQGRVFRSTDKGLNWSVSNTTLGAGSVTSLTFKDSLNGVVIDGSGTPANFSITNDGGVTWTSQNAVPPLPLNIIEYVPGTDSTLIGFSDWFRPYSQRRSAYSLDFGKTWTVFSSFIPCGGVEFISPGVGYIASVEFSNPAVHDTTIYKWNSNIFVGIEEYTEDKMNIYPNPFKTDVNIEMDNSVQIEKIEVQDYTGKIYKTIYPTNQNQYQLDLSGLHSGVYLVKVFSNKDSYTKRVIKP